MAKYVKNDAYETWPIDLTVDDSVAADSPPGNNKFEISITDGSTMFVDPSLRPDTVRVSPPVSIGQDSFDDVVLAKLVTGPMENLGPNVANFMVEAVNADGSAARRLIGLKVWNEWEVVPYNGAVRLMQRFQPQQVSGCFSGGDIGRELSYTEGVSESRSRSLNFRWDVNVAAQLGVTVGTGLASPVQAAVNAGASWSETFGIDISESVSSETHRNLNLSAHLLPTYFGVCYRQTEQMERDVDVVYHNACGASGVVGQTILTDWNFSFDIATGTDCPPATNLPPGESF